MFKTIKHGIIGSSYVIGLFLLGLLIYTIVGGNDKYFDTTKFIDVPLVIGVFVIVAVITVGYKLSDSGMFQDK